MELTSGPSTPPKVKTLRRMSEAHHEATEGRPGASSGRLRAQKAAVDVARPRREAKGRPGAPASASRTSSPASEPATGVVLLDPRGAITWTDPEARRLLALPTPSTGYHLARHPALQPARLAERLSLALRTGRPDRLLPGPVSGATGSSPVVVELDLLPIETGGPGPTGLLVLVKDATVRNREMDRARLFYQSFLRSHEAMEITDRSGLIVDVNPAFERIYGYPRDQVIGQKPKIVGSPKTPPVLYRAMWLALLDPAIGRWTGEITNLDRSGKEHSVLLNISAIQNEAGVITHFLGVATDLTDKKEFERQVARTDRLASLGQLSAGVAHELNTPLANILLISESLARRSADAWLSGRAEAIGRQVESAARIVAGLLEFSRHHPPEVRAVDLVSVVREALDFSRGKQSPDIVVEDRLGDAPVEIQADKTQLVQVFVNLINNACDAMEGRGTLTVLLGAEDGWAWVSFRDTGPGIPDDVLPKIFEPFFTTKSDTKGTGLGLSIVHGIVRAHGGSVGVETKVGHGTTFTIRLPRTQPSAAAD